MINNTAVHDPDYRTSFQDFSTFTGEVSQKIVDADETIPELPVKDVVSIHLSWLQRSETLTRQIYRIYRGQS